MAYTSLRSSVWPKPNCSGGAYARVRKCAVSVSAPSRQLRAIPKSMITGDPWRTITFWGLRSRWISGASRRSCRQATASASAGTTRSASASPAPNATAKRSSASPSMNSMTTVRPPAERSHETIRGTPGSCTPLVWARTSSSYAVPSPLTHSMRFRTNRSPPSEAPCSRTSSVTSWGELLSVRSTSQGPSNSLARKASSSEGRFCARVSVKVFMAP